jgi:Family of unknown function (DUF6624)
MRTSGSGTWYAVSPASARHRCPMTSSRSASGSTRRTPAGWLTSSPRAGWPGRSLVGEDGALAAWLIAQHADRDREQQRAFLDLLRDAVSQDEASPAHLAYLEDRVRVGQGQPQLYGTQFTVTDGELEPHPIEDPERLDERRSAVGLGPFAEYEALMRDQ